MKYELFFKCSHDPEKKSPKFSPISSQLVWFLLESFFLLLSEQALSISKDFHPVKSSFLTWAAALRQKISHNLTVLDHLILSHRRLNLVLRLLFGDELFELEETWTSANPSAEESCVTPSKAPERLLEGSREDLPTFTFIILLERREWGCRWSLKPKETF